MCYDPIVDGDDTYLYFYTDMSDEYAPWDAEGRINGVRFDATGVQYTEPGYNSYDICWIAFFRSVDDIEPFVYEWANITPVVETEPAETEEVIETVEMVSGEEYTEVIAETSVSGGDAVENGTVEETNAVSVETSTEAKAEQETTATSGGCGSTVGFGAIAMIAALAACGTVTFEKKD
jgi:hypothetical protein